MIIGLFLFGNADHRAGLAAPAILFTSPIGDDEGSFELRKLEGQRLVGVEGEACAVEDKLVLATELVCEDQRQAAFDDLSQRHLITDIEFAAIIGRTVRHEQDFRTALGQRLADAHVVPDFLADRNADANPSEIVGA
ncbi:hypothetical protein D3C80_1146920 [compost metagenome]